MRGHDYTSEGKYAAYTQNGGTLIYAYKLGQQENVKKLL
jgi:hypothetical protein